MQCCLQGTGWGWSSECCMFGEGLGGRWSVGRPNRWEGTKATGRGAGLGQGGGGGSLDGRGILEMLLQGWVLAGSWAGRDEEGSMS